MLSVRGAKWAQVDYLHGKQNLYDAKTNPRGDVLLSMAENDFLHEDWVYFVSSTGRFDKSLYAYGEGYTGTVRLRKAMANHLNLHFKPWAKIDAEEITFAAGVTDLNEVCAMLTCDSETDAIMFGMPNYSMFGRDFVMRTDVKLEHVPVGDTDQFSPSCVAGYAAGYEAAKARGVKVRALVICNPNNPLGRCYSRDALEELLRFCSDKAIHLISDEIYAMTTYQRDDRASEKFISVRSINLDELIDPNQVHVLYGMSKDYGAGGLRLGCLISQNTQFTKAARAISRFSPPSQFSMEIATRFLEDQEFVGKFLQKSRESLRDSRIFAEKLLTEAGFEYHDRGNAGLFIWVDFSNYLPTSETNGDAWAAEKLLHSRFLQGGVAMSTGHSYFSPVPGRFRLIHSLAPATVREGIRRIVKVVKP